jgi:hypothetical protein
LIKKLPDYKILANDRSICGYEIDICIPKIKLAIEWNGFLHRVPLFGFKKLASIQNNDKLKKEKLTNLKWSIIIIEDLDSKRPLQYAKKVCDFIYGLITKNKLKPGTTYEITVGQEKITT